jgi:hypothetical protein
MSHKQTSVELGMNRVSEAIVLAEPAPEFTKSWRPFSHAQILDAMTIAVKDAGLDVVKKDYSIRPDSKMMAAWEIASSRKDFNFGISILNSIDKTHSVTLGAFEKIFICSNFCFRMEYERVMFRRHSGALEIEEIIFLAKEAMKALVPMFGTLHAWHESMRSIKMNAEESALVTMAAAERKLIPPSQIPAFASLFSGSDSKYKESRGTLHAWHGAATELMNSNSLLGIAWKQDQLNYFLDYEVPLILKSGTEPVIDLRKIEKDGFVVYQKEREIRKAATSAVNKEIRTRYLETRDAGKIADRAAKKAAKAKIVEERVKARAERKATRDAKRAEREAKKATSPETIPATIKKTSGESITSGKNVKGARAVKKTDVPSTKTKTTKDASAKKAKAESDEAPLSPKETKIAATAAKLKTEKTIDKEFKARKRTAIAQFKKNPDALKIKTAADFQKKVVEILES